MLAGGQAQVPGVGGVWRDLTDSVNFMAGNLTDQVRNIAQVTTAVAQGDLSQKIGVDARPWCSPRIWARTAASSTSRSTTSTSASGIRRGARAGR